MSKEGSRSRASTRRCSPGRKSIRGVWVFPQPGGLYAATQGYIAKDGSLVIDCIRGIPFRLKLVDERGEPVAADPAFTVEYRPIDPNDQIRDAYKSFEKTWWPLMTQAAWKGDGVYEGMVLPGPGAVLVKKPDRSYRSAHVDPKAFFEPGEPLGPLKNKSACTGPPTR